MSRLDSSHLSTTNAFSRFRPKRDSSHFIETTSSQKERYVPACLWFFVGLFKDVRSNGKESTSQGSRYIVSPYCKSNSPQPPQPTQKVVKVWQCIFRVDANWQNLQSNGKVPRPCHPQGSPAALLLNSLVWNLMNSILSLILKSLLHPLCLQGRSSQSLKNQTVSVEEICSQALANLRDGSAGFGCVDFVHQFWMMGMTVYCFWVVLWDDLYVLRHYPKVFTIAFLIDTIITLPYLPPNERNVILILLLCS